MTHDGGVPGGLSRLGYQVFTELAVTTDPLAPTAKQIPQKTRSAVQSLDILPAPVSRSAQCNSLSRTSVRCRRATYIVPVRTPDARTKGNPACRRGPKQGLCNPWGLVRQAHNNH